MRIKDDVAKVLLQRAEMHLEQKKFEDCAIDCEESLKLMPLEKTKTLIAAAKRSITRKIETKLGFDRLLNAFSTERSLDVY